MARTSKSVTPRKVSTPPSMIQTHQRPSLGTTRNEISGSRDRNSVPIYQSMKEGFGLGVGVSVAQHAVNGVMNFFTTPKPSNPVTEQSQNKNIDSSTKQAEYEKCMKYSSNDSDLCKSLLNN
jgi:hypothetical protein